MTMSTGQEQQEAGTPRRGIPEDTFAVRLMLARVYAGDITVREAADRTGLNYGSWSNWERGMMPRDLIDVARAISEGLSVDFDWLLFGGPLAKPEAGSRAGMARRLRRPTAQYGDRVVRARSHSSHVPVAIGSTAALEQPCPPDNRPRGRREPASTSPALSRPAILPRRTKA